MFYETQLRFARHFGSEIVIPLSAATATATAGGITQTGVTLGLAGLAAAGTGLTMMSSAQTAKAQNAALKANQKAAMDAAIAQQRQVVDAGAVEKQKRINEAHLIQSKIRVAAGESGIGYGGTYNAMMRQADFDLAANQSILDRNQSNEIMKVRSGAAANIASLGFGATNNPLLLQGLAGAITVLQAGMAAQRIMQQMPKDPALKIPPHPGYGGYIGPAADRMYP